MPSRFDSLIHRSSGRWRADRSDEAHFWPPLLGRDTAARTRVAFDLSLATVPATRRDSSSIDPSFESPSFESPSFESPSFESPMIENTPLRQGIRRYLANCDDGCHTLRADSHGELERTLR